jgi:hypothetical protein
MLPGQLCSKNILKGAGNTETLLLLFQEYSTDKGDPYYPVPNPR